jgi:hypothetical protein
VAIGCRERGSRSFNRIKCRSMSIMAVRSSFHRAGLHGTGLHGTSLARNLGAILVALSAWSFADTARAEVRVEGTVQDVRISAKDAAIADVLAAVQARFNFRYRSRIPLDLVASGTYSGSLRRVIDRLLDRYDHVITVNPDGVTAIIIGSKSDRAIVAPIAAVPADESIVSKWRQAR